METYKENFDSSKLQSVVCGIVHPSVHDLLGAYMRTFAISLCCALLVGTTVKSAVAAGPSEDAAMAAVAKAEMVATSL
ncbi:hypothetical protein [Caballeronia grimmiae]|uniref:hypothetical protein n=1 Tax=Caballeronia grimmiae TaxID=1071679 RepID=UPI0013645D01|nr:hypothetical protein [Caballeronia grimmiae]